VAEPAVTSAREEVLNRVRHALRDVPVHERPEDVPVARDYRRQSTLSTHERIERFIDRLRDYNVDVRHLQPADLGEALSDACARLELHRVVVPASLPRDWRPDGVEVIEDRQLTPAELDAIDAAVTGCAVAIAETGTIVLDGHGTSGRRAITLVPDHHICVIHSDQILPGVPEAIAALEQAVAVDRAPITFISGPSASSDIELSRVEGVHGPRHLLALIVEGDLASRPGQD
jgi:L-lactate dehydrogenase complex protein LldG